MNRQLILKSILLFLILLISNLIYSQNGSPILDAPKLKTAIDNLIANPDSAHAQAVLDIVNGNSATLFNSYDEMRKFIKSNNSDFGFLDSLLEKVKNPKFKTEDINLSPEIFASSNATFHASNPLGLPAIDALGTFIAERFRQELEIAYLQRFKEWLEDNSKSSMALRILLPETKTVLLQNEPYQYTVFLETLKESFRKDLNNIPVNIGIYLGSDPFDIAKKTRYYFTSLLIYNNIVQIVNGKPIIDVLNSLEQDSLLPKSPEKIQSVIYLMAVTSQLLNNPAKPEEWLNAEKVRGNLNTRTNIKLFTELFMLKFSPQLKKIHISDSNLYTAIASNKEKINLILDWVKALSDNYSEIQKNYEMIKDALNQSKSIPGDAITSLENSLIISFKSFFSLRKLGIKISDSIEVEFNLVSAKVRSFTEVLVNIKEKNYGLALAKAIEMLTTFINDPIAINLVKKYGNFAVSIAKAENKDDMLAALRTAALPVGSYRIKRNSYSNISLNAYAGIVGGVQRFSSNVPPDVEKKNTILGFTAPIGLAFSWGFLNKKDSLKHSSGTIFLSAVDIGAVTAFRLKEDSTETLPELTWSNLLAPALYYVHGFKNSPISCGLGVQYGPQVRSIKNNSAEVLPSAWSARLFIAVDIPIFNFYSRTEKKHRIGKN